MVLWWQAISAGVAALVAIRVGMQQRRRSDNASSTAAAAVVYVIGDLHGDSQCAAYWVEHLGLVDTNNNNNNSTTKKWLQPDASLVFMGDYIDKGPTSLQTLEYVKSLTDAFPNKVTALLGNHEMELLKDRDPTTEIKYLQLPYATVHPQEYLNFLKRPVTETDYMVVDLLLNASLEVYANQWHQDVLFAPSVDPRYGRTAVTDIFAESLQPLIRKSLTEYQAAYLQAFGSDTDLGKWLQALPVAHVEQGVFFCHGGISQSIVDEILTVGSVAKLNKLVRKHSSETSFRPFLEDTRAGKAVAQMLVYRGNHKPGACGELGGLLNDLGVERLAVGHTPSQNVRSNCNDQFWAVDSLLGRWIRTSGNFYCPTTRRESKDGKFVCDALEASCQGQVVKIQNGKVQAIS